MVDLSACEREPVHIPGAIQPYGLLFALDLADLTVRHVSVNCLEKLSRQPAELIGQPLGVLLDEASVDLVRQALQQGRLGEVTPLELAMLGQRADSWQAYAHSSHGLVFLEFEPVDVLRTSKPFPTLTSLRETIGRLTTASNLQELCQMAAVEVRHLTGYARVMVYRFDELANGEVIAEDRQENLEPYLGLHYPASDIPAQSRALFLRNRLRVIADARYEPAPITPALNAVNGQPLDLSMSVLRSAAAVHREYLHNMGVRASLTISLALEGRLWGLIACHHDAPKHPSLSEREACAVIGKVVSAQVVSQMEAEDHAYRLRSGEILARLARRLDQQVGYFTDALLQDEQDLLALAGASGAGIWNKNQIVLIGRTPPTDNVPMLIRWLKETTTDSVFATNELPALYGEKDFAEVASGLLSLRISRDPDVYILWFRPEVVQTVNWAGDPAKAAEPAGDSGQLHPRRSFALWKETVRGKSLPWRPVELDHVRRLREFIMEAGSRTAVRLEGLLPICAWCKKIRDEPGYWREVEEFISAHANVSFTHGVCPRCLEVEMAKLKRSVRT